MRKKPSSEESENLGERMARQHFTKLLADTIVDARHKAKLTSDELAKEIGVSRGTLSVWENGRGLPDLFSFSRLAQRLYLSLDTLVLGEDMAAGLWFAKFSAQSTQSGDTAIPEFISHPPDVLDPYTGESIHVADAITELRHRIESLERKGKRTPRKT